VTSMPLLQSVNRFACLTEESINVNNTSDAVPEPVEDVQIAPKLTPCCQVPKWECQLLKHYVVASTPGPQSLHPKVELQTTDTREVLACHITWCSMDQSSILCSFFFFLNQHFILRL
jgi:hypothetical protein